MTKARCIVKPFAAFALTAAFVALSLSLSVSVGCAAATDAQMGLENAIDGSTTRDFAWGRIECGQGQVCSEVEVTRVDVRGGPVHITLRNRTQEDIAIQVGLETFAGSIEEGARTDSTGFHDVALAPRQQSVLTMWQELDRDQKLVIHLRARSTRNAS